MSQRLRLYDLLTSRLPSLVGLCQSDVPQIANYVNSAQRRLIYAKECREEGWYGTWAEVAFNVSQATPYITLPREIARLESVNVCNIPVPVQNQFYEYLAFGNGRMPKDNQWRGNNGILTSAFTRNNAVTFTEMVSAPQFIVAYITSQSDVGKRSLIEGLDASGNPIYSTDVTNNVTGTFLTFEPPSVATPMTLSTLTGIQKDITVGEVRYYQHDPATGEEILLLTMQPGETTASYRRYYLHNLPRNCCVANPLEATGCNAVQSTTLIQVTALAKLDLIPVVAPTDYLLIQNLEAIIEECQSVRLSEMDSLSAKQMAAERHKQAIGMLLGELAHFIGLNFPAVGFHPFGFAKLRRQKIGSMI
jgi:hypothetical protein